ncbi:hypothetical protein CENSYa_2048 [Cenarchaeum symbiosum A]|uniref:DUF2254 domain-containing protein n=1 Tax=Cenarchaeum symbiosum (strain A) TaxID=414004 RepID=A0RZ84_CENSY|nr:hypothetical protein CENSYa_2048 [Cenarchaeum symbiosum A]
MKQYYEDIKDKIIRSGYSDNKPPRMFRGGSIWSWFLFFFIVLDIMIFLYFTHIEFMKEKHAINLLVINTEILVTTLAVTLGATLLGIQFRAQSYTVIALIKQMNHRVVYGFVIIFISLIAFSIIPIIITSITEPGKFIPFVFLGTGFSLVYLVGYVYHMIYRLQPLEVMEEIIEKIETRIKIETIPDIEYFSTRGSERFNEWEQIMLKAVETYNVTLFTKGLQDIFVSIIA